MNKLFDDFLTYLGDPSRVSDIYNFIFTSIILGFVLFSALKVVSLLFLVVKSIYLRRQYFQEMMGVYHFFNLPVIRGDEGLARASRLVIGSGLFSPIKILQENILPKKTLYECRISNHYTMLFYEMRSEDKSGDKYMITTPPRYIDGGARKLLVGIMLSVNFRGEPFASPILITNKNLSVGDVSNILSKLQARGTTLDIEAIKEATHAVDECIEAESGDIFEYPHGSRGPIEPIDL